MYSILNGRELPDDLDDQSVDQLGGLETQPGPIDQDNLSIVIPKRCRKSR